MNNGSSIPPSSSSGNPGTTIYPESYDYNLEEADQDFLEKNSGLFLDLRYYARHFLPIFCVVGIIGNCMALILIR